MRLSAAIARRPTFVPGTTGTTDTPAAERHLAGATFALAAGLVLFGNAFSSLPTGLQDHLGVVTAKVVLAAAIAATLFLTERAVEKVIHSIFLKLGLTWEQATHKRVRAVVLYLAESS